MFIFHVHNFTIDKFLQEREVDLAADRYCWSHASSVLYSSDCSGEVV